MWAAVGRKGQCPLIWCGPVAYLPRLRIVRTLPLSVDDFVGCGGIGGFAFQLGWEGEAGERPLRAWQPLQRPGRSPEQRALRGQTNGVLLAFCVGAPPPLLVIRWGQGGSTADGRAVLWLLVRLRRATGWTVCRYP